jgi:murein DD-endopeptidase MepM/ murein hydrolase activator NlpD
MLRRTSLIAVGMIALAGAACRPTSAPPAPAPAPRDLVLAPDTETVTGRVPANATFDTLLRDNLTRADLIPGLVSLASSVFDLRRLRTDQPYRLVRTLDGELRRFEYEIDLDRFLRIAPRDDRIGIELTAEVVPFEKTHTMAAVRGAISRGTPSLFEAMELAGEQAELSIALAEVFAGDIDFNVDLQPGDQFAAVVGKMTREGVWAGYGPIVVAEFANAGRRLRAIRFTPPGGKPGYYDENGRSLKRFLLASPLKFTPRVSSRFSRQRLHPVLRVYRPHLGVDYAAGYGAPVVAAAGGVVTRAGPNGQAGRMVQLRHPNGYETLYMHLASIAAGVRVGARVEQGQLIGRVGSSGLSTGAHLDYRIRRGGVYVNPLLEHKRMPPGDPIAPAAMPLFEAERDRVLALLPAAGAGAPSPSSPR